MVRNIKKDYPIKDKYAIMNVLAGIVKDPMVLMDDHYQLVPDDFPERFHRIVFGALEHVIRGGAKNVDALVIDDYLQSYKDQYKIFTDNNGVAYINSIVELTDGRNFAYFYTRLKKASLLNRLYQQGFDISDYWDPSIVAMTEAERTQTKFDTVTLEEILDDYEIKLGNIKDAFGDAQGRHGVQAGTKMKELKEELKAKPEIGAPMNSAKMTTICRGRRLKKFYLKVAPSGTGKSIPNSTRLYTFNKGWITAGEVRQGDLLIGRNGKPTKVLQIHPQKEPKEIYEVRFKDGRMAKCCKDHRWLVRDENGTPNRRWWVKTTQEIYELGAPTQFHGTCCPAWRFQVPLCAPVEFEKQCYDIPPYVMGAMLGNGSFRQYCVAYSSEDDWVPNKICQIMGWEHKKHAEPSYTYYFSPIGESYLVQTRSFLEEHPELIGTYSHTKFIPEQYFIGSVEQRFELLQGLLDTDGSVGSKGRVSFSTTSVHLKDGVLELCRSLGLIATASPENRTRYKSGACYNVRIQAAPEIKTRLFSLPRKLEKLESYYSGNQRRECKETNPIVSITPTGRYTDMTCFTVDAPDGLFLMNDYIVTHNTRMSLADACFVSIPKRFDLERKRWVKTGCQEPTLFITTELEIEEVQTMIQAYVSGVPEEHILDGKYEPGEEARVDKAISVIQDAPLWIEHVPDFNVDDIENIIKEHKLKHQIAYCFFDYIFTSIKILTEVATKARGVKLREDNVLVMFSDRLKGICNKLNVHIDTSTQVSGDWKNAKDPDASLIRGAKGIADKVDVGYVVLEPTPKDLEAVKSILAANGQAFGQKPNLVFHVFKLRRGKLNHVKVFVHFDFSTLRTTDMFVTDRNYQLLSVDNTSVEMLLDQTDISEEADKNGDKATRKW